MVGAETGNGWTVNLWGSNPKSNIDDCWTGEDGLDEAQARAIYTDPASAPHDWIGWHLSLRDTTLWIEIVGPGCDEARQIKAGPLGADSWLGEIAMQAGMGLGVEAYNDAIGSGQDDDSEADRQRDAYIAKCERQYTATDG